MFDEGSCAKLLLNNLEVNKSLVLTIDSNLIEKDDRPKELVYDKKSLKDFKRNIKEVD